MADIIIQLHNVSWAYARAGDWALKNINLEIGQGEFIAVMGENGAGKTSFCRLMNGLIPHSLTGKLLGTVTIGGILTSSATVAQLAEKTGTVFEDPQSQLFTARAKDEVAFALENILVPQDEIQKKVFWALDVTGLSSHADSAPSELSGGQKQRLAIAAALAMAEKILVLDEPCSQLDPEGAQEVLSLIRELRLGKKLTVLMATNSAEEAAEFADRICVLKNGELAACDTPQRIFANQSLLADCAIPSPRPLVFSSHQPHENTSPIVQIADLSYEYVAGKAVLHNINLSIGENEFTAIMGKNGCGKTTLLKNISGLLRPSRGNILLRQQDTAKMSIAEIAGQIGFVMQDPDCQLFESTVYDEAAFSLKRQKIFTKNEIQQKVEEALSLVGLLDKRDSFPPALNRADRVKTVFAAVLAMGPKILMLDEPVAGQDMRGCRLIMDILENLYRQGYTIIMVTHNTKVIAEYARRLIVMQDGNVYMDGKPESLLT